MHCDVITPVLTDINFRKGLSSFDVVQICDATRKREKRQRERAMAVAFLTNLAESAVTGSVNDTKDCFKRLGTPFFQNSPSLHLSTTLTEPTSLGEPFKVGPHRRQRMENAVQFLINIPSRSVQQSSQLPDNFLGTEKAENGLLRSMCSPLICSTDVPCFNDQNCCLHEKVSNCEVEEICDPIPPQKRVMYCTRRRLPFSFTSFISWDSNSNKRKVWEKEDNLSNNLLSGSVVNDGFTNALMKRMRKNEPTYYGHILWPTSPKDILVDDYDPFYIDNPDKKSEKSRKAVSLQSYRTSIIPYVKKKELKASINEQMLFTHPWIEELRLTLTSIRKIKTRMMTLARARVVEVSTVAHAIVYLEKLIIKKCLNKDNRKLVSSACLMLAAKFWEPSVTSESNLDKLTEKIVIEFSVTKKKLLALEFWVFAELEFSLLLPIHQVYPHYVRLLAEYFNLTPKEYNPFAYHDSLLPYPY